MESGPTPPFWTGTPGAEQFARAQEARLARAREAIDRLAAVRGRRTLDNTLRPYDDCLLELDAASSQASLIENVHPDPALRDAAQAVAQQAAALATAVSLDRAVYDALQSLDLGEADAETRHYVEKTLRKFRLAGVDRDPATRRRIEELRDELVLISQEFSRHLRQHRRTVTVRDPDELDGLPDDYVARHRPDENGVITLTLDTPDAMPVLTYARNDDLRRRMYQEYNNRAYPQNLSTLERMIARRHELAGLLGFPHWADYVTADKMAGSASTVGAFIDRVATAAGSRAESDHRALLERKRREVAGADRVEAWEAGYYAELVRRADYDFDAQELRPYLPYARAKQGVLDLTARLFGVAFRRVPDAPVWDRSVECHEMLDRGRVAGRFYLDMHPRKDKFKHAAQFDLQTGVAGRQIPEAALVCNFPGGEPGDPGLMEHADVRTLFHEFGHLLHGMLAGNRRWLGTGGIRTERDFIEVPSQLLEEWTWDPAVLATFARHHRTGEPVPADLVRRLNRAHGFGRGLHVRRQMMFAGISLACYERPPREVNTDAIVRELAEKHQPFPFVEGTHPQCSFGHLDGYSATYYTYMWSLVIAKDLFGQFDRLNLLDPEVAARYRACILEPGGSAPAAELVERFLGRPFSHQAWREWLDEGVA